MDHRLRLSQICLGRQPKDGERNLVEVTMNRNGRNITTAITALRAGVQESQLVDLEFNEGVHFALVEGSGPVCLSGIQITEVNEVEEMEGPDGPDGLEGPEEEVDDGAEEMQREQEMKMAMKKMRIKMKKELKKAAAAAEKDEDTNTGKTKKRKMKASMDGTEKKTKKSRNLQHS